MPVSRNRKGAISSRERDRRRIQHMTLRWQRLAGAFGPSNVGSMYLLAPDACERIANGKRP